LAQSPGASIGGRTDPVNDTSLRCPAGGDRGGALRQRGVAVPFLRAGTSRNHPELGEWTVHRDVEFPLDLAERAEASARMRS